MPSILCEPSWFLSLPKGKTAENKKAKVFYILSPFINNVSHLFCTPHRIYLELTIAARSISSAQFSWVKFGSLTDNQITQAKFTKECNFSPLTFQNMQEYLFTGVFLISNIHHYFVCLIKIGFGYAENYRK